MGLIITFLAAAFLIAGVVRGSFVNKRANEELPFPTPVSQEVEGSTDDRDVPYYDDDKEEDEVIETITPFIPTPTVSDSQTSDSRATNAYIYPNSTVLSTTANSIELSSTSDPGDITNWYKKLFEEKHFKARSFAQTNTNGHVLNKLAGAGGSLDLEVEIEKKPNEKITVIKVTY